MKTIQCLTVCLLLFLVQLVHAGENRPPADPKMAIETIDHARIGSLKGFRHIAVLDSLLFVTSFHNTQAIFFINLNTHALDSICISDSLLQHVYGLCGINASVGDVKRYMRQNRVPLPAYRFQPELDVNGKSVSMYLNVFYFDPELPVDTNRPAWYSLETVFSPANRKLAFKLAGSSANRNLPLIYESADTIWSLLPGSNGAAEPILFNYTADRSREVFRFRSFKDPQALDGVRHFPGVNFNNSRTYFSYNYRRPYLFFEEDATIYDVLYGKQIDLSNTIHGLSMMHDLQVGPTTVDVLCQEGESVALYTLLRDSYRNIKRRHLFRTSSGSLLNGISNVKGKATDVDLNASSNLILSGNHIYFINQSGRIVRISMQ